MPEMLFESEYVQGKRTAHVLKNLTHKYWTVYCYCCGHEHETDAFETLFEAEQWAESWVRGEVEVPELLAQAQEQGGCSCNH